MGDLANTVKYASNFAADDPFVIDCKWNGVNEDITLKYYLDEQLIATAGVICELSYKAKPVLEVKLPLSFVIRVLPQDETLTISIAVANVFNPEYKSLDPNYIVTDETLGRYSIGRLLDAFAKTHTFGTGFKITKRKFPSVHIST